jgi:hypothetical protein
MLITTHALYREAQRLVVVVSKEICQDVNSEKSEYENV